ncbi:MAG: hypothetical protein ACP5S8_03070, partial [Hydrogenobaculum sp.]
MSIKAKLWIIQIFMILGAFVGQGVLYKNHIDSITKYIFFAKMENLVKQYENILHISGLSAEISDKIA